MNVPGAATIRIAHRWAAPGRLWWLALALLHTPVLVRVAGTLLSGPVSPQLIGSAMWLLAAFALFLLKFVDAPFLRVRCRRTSVVLFLLICAVAHRGVAPPAAHEEPTPRAIVVLSTLMLAGAAAMELGRRRGGWARRGVRRCRPAAPTGLVAPGDTGIVRWILKSRTAASRAPPA